MVVEFPRRLLRERGHSWNLVGVATTPGVAKSVAPIVRSDGGGFWTCSMSDISLSGAAGLSGKRRQRESTLLWRAVRQIANGGVTPLVVPRNDTMFRPWPESLPHKVGIDVPHDDDALFSDGDGYYQSIIDIVCGPAALRATSLYIAVNYAGELMGGEAFSINHPNLGWRMYEISTVEMSDTDSGYITFNPPLREAVEAGTALEFDRPRCLMRLAKTSSMDLSVTPWTFNSGSVDFVETFA
ncbi:hypothetical protein [Bradyrhizobium liaoningense]|uniref:hypothetical protein n=1 Tax=Bradyrhizobium liaoningense TaxID=43992 RepID=UPI00054F25D2|nr:hypothetical protein [Bradyrhizobium liaoningense]